MRVTDYRTALYAVLLGALGAGCAGGVRPIAVTPEALAALDAERAARPDDPDPVVRAGIAWYRAGRPELARDILAMALVLDPNRFDAAIHLGLAQQQLGDWRAAREAYHRAGAMRLSRGQRSEVESRLTWLGRLELVAEAREAVAREQRQEVLPVSDHVVAVLPFHYLGADESLRSLGRGLTHLVVTDLSRIGRLTLLERERVQALVDELELAANGQTDPAHAVRSGRLLGAARVVQGSVRELTSGGAIQIAASVVNTADGGVGASGSGEDRLQRLFDLEKRIVFDLLDQLGIVPTPAERRAIGARPTADLQAFLAFSQGLEASDRGDFPAARRLFDAAAARDGSFGEARERGIEVQRISAALRSAPDRLAVLSRPPRAESLGRAVSGVSPSVAGQLEQRAADPGRRPNRGQVQEGLKRDDPTLIGLIGTIIIVVPRP